MTTEEKAKAYDEALKRAKAVCDMYRNGWVDKSNLSMVDIEYVFPQLAESEDERIRKELMVFISQFAPEHLKVKYMAWLEKQKEEEGYEAIPIESTLEYKVGKHAGFLEGLAEGRKQTEQKPVEWSKEDEEVRQSLLRDYEYAMQSSGTVWGKDFEKKYNWLKSLHPSWKPSEEQMNAIDYVLRYDKTGGFRDALKSLYDQLYNMYNDV